MKGENHLSRLDETKLYEELSRSNLPATKRWYVVTGALLLAGPLRPSPSSST